MNSLADWNIPVLNPPADRPSRSRIELGSSALVYLAASALVLGAAWQTQNNLLFWAFGLMIGGVVASLAVAWWSLSGISVTRILPEHAVAGEPMVIRYLITNRRRWLPCFNLTLMENWGRGARGWRYQGPVAEHPPRLPAPPWSWVTHIGPRQSVQAQAFCRPCRRGYLEFERIVVTCSFPFGLIRRTAEFHHKARVLVYPTIYRLRPTFWHRLAATDPAGHLEMDRGGGTEEFFGLRRYRPGDSLKTIDWRHSARLGELISREFTVPSPPRLMLLLDLRTPPPQAPSPPPAWWRRWAVPWQSYPAPEADNQVLEQALSLAASIVCWGHLNGYQVGMQILGPSPIFFRIHHSLPHRTRMLEALARLDLKLSDHSAASRPAETPALRLAAEPNVVIRASPTGLAPRRCVVLNAWEISHYVQQIEGGATRLLRRQLPMRSRKQITRR